MTEIDSWMISASWEEICIYICFVKSISDSTEGNSTTWSEENKSSSSWWDPMVLRDEISLTNQELSGCNSVEIESCGFYRKGF